LREANLHHLSFTGGTRDFNQPHLVAWLGEFEEGPSFVTPDPKGFDVGLKFP
jgi:hypothetical protein